MAALDVTTNIPTSFVYEQLISHVQAIQQQIIEKAKLLDERKKNENKIQNELKSRSLSFVDPFGNVTTNKYMDHEVIHKIVKKYKKDYVPRYLQYWIRIGTKNSNDISPIGNDMLKSTVSQYADGHQFVTYGEVTVRTGNYEGSSLRLFVLPVLLTDNMDEVKMRLNKLRTFPSIELRSIITNELNKDSWNEGITLNSNDTIVSSQLYQQNCIIMGKVSKPTVNGYFFLLA